MSDISDIKSDIKSEKEFPNKQVNVLKTFDILNDDIKMLMNKNEEVVKAYLERQVYTSNISTETNTLLNKIFQKIKNDILSSSHQS